MRKASSAQEKEKDLHRVQFRGEERMIAIRTPLLLRICIDSGLFFVKMSHECTKTTMIQSSKTKTVTRAVLGHESLLKKDRK